VGYSKKAVTGFGWLTGLKVGMKTIAVIKIAILARLFGPTVFGVFGITMAVLALVEKFTETGINTFLVQKQQDVRVYINAAWVIAIIRGILITSAILLLAFVLPNFYREQSLQSFLLIAAIIPLVKAFINPSIVLWWKQLEYQKDVLFRGFLSIIEHAGAILLVWYTHNPVGLLVALLFSAFVEVVLSHMLIPTKPKLVFDKSRILEILKASRLLNLGSLFSFLISTIDNLVIGKILGVNQLGYYQNAYTVSHTLTADVGELGAQTVFPIYVKLRSDKKRLIRACLLAVIPLAVITLIPIAILLSFPHQLVGLILGEKWFPIIPLLPWLLAALYLKTINSVLYPIFLALEHVGRNVAILFIQLAVLLSLLIPLSQKYGLIGGAASVFICYLVVQPLIVLALMKSLKK
jgi:lipopolysaccharide exporter